MNMESSTRVGFSIEIKHINRIIPKFSYLYRKIASQSIFRKEKLLKFE